MQNQIAQPDKAAVQNKNNLRKIGRISGRFIFSLIKPHIPLLIIFVLIIIFTALASVAIFSQFTADSSDIVTEQGKPADEYIKYAVDKANKRSQFDVYGRDIMLELTKEQVLSVLIFSNTASFNQVTEQEIDRIVNILRPEFEYETHERIVEYLEPVKDPATGEIMYDEQGNIVKEWKMYSCGNEYLLKNANTMLGNYTYTYKKVTETTDDMRITYMQPYEVKLTSEPYERLKNFLIQDFNLKESDIDIAIQAILETATGLETKEDKLSWLLGSTANVNTSYIGIPHNIMLAINEASQKYGIPNWLIAAIMRIESGFNPLARNANTHAYGLMQIMPFHIESGLFEKLGFNRILDRDNPRAQAIAGTELLYRHIEKYIQPELVDWNSAEWKKQTLKGLANYGGYTNDQLQTAQAEYVSKIWTAAETYKQLGINTSMIWVLPNHTTISSKFGMRYHPIDKEWKIHTGIDIPAPEGTPILSATSGQVVFSGWGGAYGNMVVIETGPYQLMYAHNSKNFVSEGDTVYQGQQIAQVGNTGKSTGAHLHFGISIGDYRNGRFVDPLLYIKPPQRSE